MMTTISIPSQSLGLESESPGITVTSNFSGTTGWRIDLQDWMYPFLVWLSIKDEFLKVPENERIRAEQFLNSNDPEMPLLAYAILDQYLSEGIIKQLKNIKTGAWACKYELEHLAKSNCVHFISLLINKPKTNE